ncbi:guanitoxin biosynthesis L-enduracididine beta-hydroxylase GntD [Streptomyces xanthophaeus]|uniref:guanitoxin biosynthesis L-enduracididine beta-hydroxylase GntD n=1 Tax=Streptomyces xanthophaeus TaxID=67385 RepID=UPI00367DBA1F
MRPLDPIQFDLSPLEAAHVCEMVEHELHRIDSDGASNMHDRASLTAHALPERLVRFLQDFRNKETAGACLVRGWPINDEAVGRTPDDWRYEVTSRAVLKHEIYLILLSSLLGDIFAWSTVQDGHLVQDLLPVQGQELEKNAGSSESLLDLHTEDAFSPLRCDYLSLFCLRNDDGVPTAYSSVDSVRHLTTEHRRVLAEPRFVLTPDPEHFRRAIENGEDLPVPQKTSILFGDPASPYIAFDEFFIETEADDREASIALAALTAQLNESQLDVALEPGDALFLDNYRAVHGRKPFQARYDGRDRWLKRISVTRDLRRSRGARSSVQSRVVRTGII